MREPKNTQDSTSENVPDLLTRCDFSYLNQCGQALRTEKPFRRSPDCSFITRLLALSLALSIGSRALVWGERSPDRAQRRPPRGYAGAPVGAALSPYCSGFLACGRARGAAS